MFGFFASKGKKSCCNQKKNGSAFGKMTGMIFCSQKMLDFSNFVNIYIFKCLIISFIFLYFISANSSLKLQGSRHIIIGAMDNMDRFIVLKRVGRKNNKSEVKIINSVKSKTEAPQKNELLEPFPVQRLFLVPL